MTPVLAKMLASAKTYWESMSPEERAAEIKAQRCSWVRGEMGMGSDRDEAEYASALARGDTETLARLDAEAEARRARADKIMEESDE